MTPDYVAGIMSRYPEVRSMMSMTSCLSGHWAEMTELQNNKLTMLAAAGPGNDVVSLPMIRGRAFHFTHTIRAHQGAGTVARGYRPGLGQGV